MPNREAVFLDTSGWIALLDSDDLFHRQAAERLEECGAAHRRVVTTDWVLAETGNGLARLPARGQFARAIAIFLASPNSRLVRVNAELFDEALALYERAADKSWGLVDCASFVVMRRDRIVDALSADHHFRQAGFHCLLVPPTS